MSMLRHGPQVSAARRIVSVRAMAIACAFMPLLAAWVVESELVWDTAHSTAISLFTHVGAALFALALVNYVIRKRWPEQALTGSELLTIYVMWSVAGTIVSHDMLQVLLPLIAFPHHLANPQNRWAEIMLPYVKPWAIVPAGTATTELMVGNTTLYRWSVWGPLWKPLAFWSLVLLTLMWAWTCLASLFRQAWTDKERLSFPVIQIPLMLATRLEWLLRSRGFWVGFGIAGLIDVVNGLHVLYPNVPAIPVINVFNFAEYFTERPWNAILQPQAELNLYPFVIGFCYLLPTDLMFSCWFFFIVYKLQLVVTSALGLYEVPGMPFVEQQAMGSYLALGLLALWAGRKYIVGVIRTACGVGGGVDEREEPMRYRTMVVGFAVSVGLLIVYGMALGASLWMMVVYFVIFMLYSLAIARMRAELGPPAHDLHFAGPEVLITDAVGTARISKENLTVFSLFFGFNRAYRAHYAAHAIEAYKGAQVMRVAARSMLVAMSIAIVVGLVTGVWAVLHSMYVKGTMNCATGLMGMQGWQRLEGWLTMPEGPRGAATAAAVIGGLVTIGLGFMRMQFTWWVWHPVGYAICSSWSMNKLWACMFIAWAVKGLITRYGGAKAYQAALPFFVGLVLGEFAVGSVWSVIGVIGNMAVYKFWG